jgi:uncharacterized surface protein with fasciclin (FAS1) repeats
MGEPLAATAPLFFPHPPMLGPLGAPSSTVISFVVSTPSARMNAGTSAYKVTVAALVSRSAMPDRIPLSMTNCISRKPRAIGGSSITPSAGRLLRACSTNGRHESTSAHSHSFGTFKTLVAAVQAAGLVDTLKGKGPFTVFAPSDDAFAKLPAGTVEGLLKDLPKLKSILTYHVVAGRVTAADVMTLTTAKTVQGQTVAFQTNGGVKVNGAKVVTADVMADNGIIHVIDSVILPR